MVTEFEPVSKDELLNTLNDSANQIGFLNVALMAIGEHKYELVDEELCGLQNIMFAIEGKLRASCECLSKHPQPGA